MTAPLSAEAERLVIEILDQFDAASTEFRFPELGHGYYFAVDARLHAYSNANRWAMIVEAVGYNPRGGNLYDVLHVFSNSLTTGRPGYENEDFLPLVDNFDELEGETETYRGAVPIVVKRHSLTVSAPAGTRLEQVFRELTPAHRDLLLAEEPKLRRRIPADLPEVMRLDDWHQPDLFEHRPSESETYRLLAEVLATADPSRYRPTLRPNTHWSNWPDSGSL